MVIDLSRFARLSPKPLGLGLKPPPPQRYPLSEGQAALQSLADGGVLGKVVLEP
jgi:NADPH:quinone reductase